MIWKQLTDVADWRWRSTEAKTLKAECSWRLKTKTQEPQPWWLRQRNWENDAPLTSQLLLWPHSDDDVTNEISSMSLVQRLVGSANRTVGAKVLPVYCVQQEAGPSLRLTAGCSKYYKLIAFSALTLLVGRQEQHLACKNWVTRRWCGYLSGERCRLLAGI